MRGLRAATPAPPAVPTVAAPVPERPRLTLKPLTWYVTPDDRWLFAVEWQGSQQILAGVVPHEPRDHPARTLGAVAAGGKIHWSIGPHQDVAPCELKDLTEIRGAERCEVCWAVACPFCAMEHTAFCPRFRRRQLRRGPCRR